MGATNRILALACVALVAMILLDKLSARVLSDEPTKPPVVLKPQRNWKPQPEDDAPAKEVQPEKPKEDPPAPVEVEDIASTATVVKPKSMWEDDEDLKVNFPKDTQYAIVEVGTNANPDYLQIARRSPGAFVVGLEPIVTSNAIQTCARNGGGKCKILNFAVGPHEQKAVMNVGAATECSSLLPLNDPTSMCNRKVRSHNVKVIRLDTLLAYAIPPEMPIKILMLDMQGFDLYGAASLTEKHFLKNRIANFLIECQDYPVGDSRFLSPGSKSCGETISCITKHWRYGFVGCTPNMGPAEYNCMFYNPDHKDGDPQLRHPFKSDHALKKEMDYPAECPSMFIDISLVPTLPTPDGTPARQSGDARKEIAVAPVRADGEKPASRWSEDPEVVDVKIPAQTSEVIIEVGTNRNPDFLPLLRKRKGAFLIGMEPVVTQAAVKTCAGNHRCKIMPIAIGPNESIMQMSVARISECSTLLPLPDPKADCNKKVGSKDVKVVRLDTLLSYVVPKDIPVSILALDMQGFDLYGAASLTNREIIDKQVANFVLECQDLPVGSPVFLSPGAKSCGETVSCITKHWGYEFLGCSPNMGPKEFNCMFTNTKHPMSDMNFRHMFKSHLTPSKEIEHPAECPDMFLNPTK